MPAEFPEGDCWWPDLAFKNVSIESIFKHIVSFPNSWLGYFWNADANQQQENKNTKTEARYLNAFLINHLE